MTIVAGTQLGRYEIRSKIGAGGMGEVYLAQDTKLDRKVALKILPAEVASNEDRMKRFVQEAKAASALNHPNIITIYEVEQIDSVNFIATEFIDGLTLRARMRNTSPMKLAEVLNAAAQIASALSAAHAAGIVHRDIKPENIMLRRDGIVKVLDFGLAKLTERLPPDSVDAEAATKALVHTEPGVVLGTVAYMSPEQARGMAVDARTDIFSLGVVIYEMVAGQAPFGGATRSDLIVALLERDPPPLARFTAEAPAELERLVMKTLAKDREERYQTAKDLLIDLKGLKQKLVVDAEIERSVPRAKAAAMRALELDETLAEAHTSLARVLAVYDWDWAGAEKEFKRAIELNPRYAVAHQWYGGYLEIMGRPDESIAERKRAQEFDPLSLMSNFELGMGFYFARNYDQAIEEFQKTLELDPNFPLVHAHLPAAYEQKGMYDEAIAGFQKGITLRGGTEWSFSMSGLGHVYGVLGKKAEARAVLDELKQMSRQEYVPADGIALVYAGLGEKDQAFTWLEKAYDEHAFKMAWLKVEPQWDSSDPRFADLLRRVGLSK
ncbi:MAG TPA: serine/threonine-protein kinase [Pyrinomonadaceae bacterium]|nr:serine/threonine-protein kinase [Pyrinomonadaceae bacterium]